MVNQEILINLTDTGVGCFEWCKEQSYSFVTRELLYIPIIIVVVNIVVMFIYNFAKDDETVSTAIEWQIYLNLLMIIGYIVQLYLLYIGKV